MEFEFGGEALHRNQHNRLAAQLERRMEPTERHRALVVESDPELAADFGELLEERPVNPLEVSLLRRRCGS